MQDVKDSILFVLLCGFGSIFCVLQNKHLRQSNNKFSLCNLLKIHQSAEHTENCQFRIILLTKQGNAFPNIALLTQSIVYVKKTLNIISKCFD